jgi:poly(3-hydroxybutyrate) depolymerase
MRNPLALTLLICAFSLTNSSCGSDGKTGTSVVPDGGSPEVSDAGSDAVKSPGCGSATLVSTCDTAATGPCTLTVAGIDRQYYVVLPPHYNDQTAYPIVFTWHWMTGTAQDLLPPGTAYAAPYYGIATGFPEAIYVVPQGLPTASGATDYGWPNTNGQDLDFAKAMVSSLESSYCVDESRIFSAGMSYGSEMSEMLGCEAPDIFRAIGVMSGALFTATHPCQNHPVGAWITHGTADTSIDISNDEIARDQFIRVNGCDTTNTQQIALDANTTCTIYNVCSTGEYPVVWCPVQGEGHAIPSWAGSQIAKFFRQIGGGTEVVASDAGDVGSNSDSGSTASLGYAQLGAWGGYPFTYLWPSSGASAGTTISPNCSGPGSCTPALSGSSMCASGTVGADATLTTSAGVGFDFQPESPGSSASPITLSSSSVTISFSNAGGSNLVVNLVSDPSGSTFWCYELRGATSPVTIPLSSFNTACWNSSGQSLSPGTQVAGIFVYVPSSATTNVPFDFCLLGIGLN